MCRRHAPVDGDADVVALSLQDRAVTGRVIIRASARAIVRVLGSGRVQLRAG